MPKFTLPPEKQLTTKPFDPLTLDRTVIAIPLLQQMEPELELIRKADTMILKNYNTAIELNPVFKGGLPAAEVHCASKSTDWLESASWS